MLKFWRAGATDGRPPASDIPEIREEQTSPGMALAVQSILASRPHPEILDLGRVCGSTAVYLAERGARVSVEDFDLPDDTVGDANVAIDQPDGRFDLVLAWEHFDFVPPRFLVQFTSEVRRVMAPGGWLLLFARDGVPDQPARDTPGSYRIVADDRMLRRRGPGPARMRWTHHNRAIESALAPLDVRGVRLRPNRMREFLVHKPAD